MTPKQLSERFDISIAAAELRLQEIERMKRRKQGTRRPLPPGVREYLLKAKQSGHTLITKIDD
jgi:hypothetical protein